MPSKTGDRFFIIDEVELSELEMKWLVWNTHFLL